MTRAPCRRRTGEAIPRAEKFGDLITEDHKVLNEGCESRDNHRLLNGFNLFRVKQILHTRHRKHRKLCIQTTRLNLGEHVKVYHGITALQHLIDPRQMASLKSAVRRVKEGTSAVSLQSGLDEAIAICETFKISRLMGRLHTRDVLENLSKGQ